MADPAPAQKPRARWSAVALRWTLALSIGVGGAYLVRRWVTGYQGRAATRLVLLDFARFQGCLFGAPPPAEADVADRALALALGTGDPVWPHTCAPALGRVIHEAEDVASDDANARALAEAARGMENALALAEIWTDRAQHGTREPPAWVAAFIELRREVSALAQRRGLPMPPPEVPGHPRVPRVGGDPPPPPIPMPLAGGDEADLVDVTVTPAEFAVLLRDRRSRYSVCHVPLPIAREPDRGTLAHLRCRSLDIPRMADPRDVGFVPSERGAHLAVWSRAPSMMRALVDVDSGVVELLAAGRADAHRDFWAGARTSIGLQITGEGVALIASDGGTSPRQVPLPGSLDVLVESRALLVAGHAAAAVWIDPRSRHRADVIALPLGATGDPLRGAQRIASFPAPRMTGPGRVLQTCSPDAGAAWVAVGDERGASLFRTENADVFVRGPDLPRGIDARTELVCDRTGLTVVGRTNASVEAIDCDAERCLALPSWPSERVVSVARVEGAVLVADGGGPEGTLRVRRFAPAGTVEQSTPAAIEGPAVPVRALALVHQGPTVAAFVAASRTNLLVSLDGGAHFAPVLTDLPPPAQTVSRANPGAAEPPPAWPEGRPSPGASPPVPTVRP